MKEFPHTFAVIQDETRPKTPFWVECSCGLVQIWSTVEDVGKFMKFHWDVQEVMEKHQPELND